MMMDDDEESACYLMSYNGISLMVVLNWPHLLRKPEGAEAVLPTSSCQSQWGQPSSLPVNEPWN